MSYTSTRITLQRCRRRERGSAELWSNWRRRGFRPDVAFQHSWESTWRLDENIPNSNWGVANAWGLGHLHEGEREGEDGTGAHKRDMAEAGEQEEERRGVGNAAWPILFALCIEPPAELIRGNDKIEGIIDGGGMMHKIALFTDDILLFNYPLTSIPALMWCLSYYGDVGKKWMKQNLKQWWSLEVGLHSWTEKWNSDGQKVGHFDQ